MRAVSPATGPASAAGRATPRSNSNDELLARQAGRGSERAFAALYERYHQALYRYCRSIVRDETDAQDALQSAFAGALSALKRGQRNAPVRPWLFRIAHNESISLLRRRDRDGERKLALAGPQFWHSAEDEAAERARWALLMDDLGELPDRLRSALLLRELSGLSHEEIAIALGTTVGGAKQAVFEARHALSELAEGRAMECEAVRRTISDGDGRALRGRRVRAHLRGCGACEGFATGIRTRQADLRAFAPVLPPAAAVAVLAGAIRTVSGHGGAAAASSAGSAGVTSSAVPATATSAAATSSAATSSVAAAGAVGKAASAAIAWKVLAGVAVVATAGAGVAGLAHVVQPSAPPSRAHSRVAHPSGAHRLPAGSHAATIAAGGLGAAAGLGAGEHSGRGRGAATGHGSGRGLNRGTGTGTGTGGGSHGPGGGRSGASSGSTRSKPLHGGAANGSGSTHGSSASQPPAKGRSSGSSASPAHSRAPQSPPVTPPGGGSAGSVRNTSGISPALNAPAGANGLDSAQGVGQKAPDSGAAGALGG